MRNCAKCISSVLIEKTTATSTHQLVFQIGEMMTTKRAVYYARVSTTEQISGTSLNDQARVCEATIAARGWELTDKFVDEGLSGTDASRPEWSRLLAGANNRDFDVVVVSKLDRFSRKASDAIRETDRLDELGVALVVVKENIDMSTSAGRMMRTMLAGIAELERDTIVSRTTAGQRAKALEGRWPGGKPAFGWRLDGFKKTAHAVPDERERQILQIAYDHITAGGLFSDLADHLNAQNLLTRGGKLWDRENLRNIMHNETLYTGKMLWGNPKKTGGHSTRLNADGTAKYGDPITRQLPEPPFTQEQYRVLHQAIAARGRTNPRTGTKSQLLTGRLFGACNKPYGGVSYQSRPSDGYRCRGNRYRSRGRKHEMCGCAEVRVNSVDPLVWGALAEFLEDPKRLERMAEDYLAGGAMSQDSGQVEKQLMTTQKQVAKYRLALQRAKADQYLSDDPEGHQKIVEGFRVKLSELERHEDRLTREISGKTTRRAEVTNLVALTKRASTRLRTMGPEERRELVDLLDLRVMMGQVVAGGPLDVTIEGSIGGSLGEPNPARNTNQGACSFPSDGVAPFVFRITAKAN